MHSLQVSVECIDTFMALELIYKRGNGVSLLNSKIGAVGVVHMQNIKFSGLLSEECSEKWVFALIKPGREYSIIPIEIESFWQNDKSLFWFINVINGAPILRSIFSLLNSLYVKYIYCLRLWNSQILFR